MRTHVAVPLVASLAAIAHADAPRRVRGDHVVQLAAPPSTAPNALQALLPDHPFTAPPVRIGLPGPVAAPPWVEPDGTMVVAIASPPSVAWIDPRGHLRTTAALDERPALRELVPGADGLVFVRTESPALEAVAPDGSVRASFPLGAWMPAGAVTRVDDAVVFASNASSLAGELHLVATDGSDHVTRALPGAVLDGPARAPGGRGYVLLAQGVYAMAHDGSVDGAPYGRGAVRMSVLGDDTVALENGSSIEFRSARGSVRARVATGPIEDRWPLPDGGLVIVRSGTPAELWRFDGGGAVTSRTTLASARPAGILADANGTLLITSASGELVAMARDGTVRWSMVLHDTVSIPPVARRGGGVVLAPGSGGLLLLH